MRALLMSVLLNSAAMRTALLAGFSIAAGLAFAATAVSLRRLRA